MKFNPRKQEHDCDFYLHFFLQKPLKKGYIKQNISFSFSFASMMYSLITSLYVVQK